MKATAATVSSLGRYQAIAAFSMTDDAKRTVTKILRDAGFVVGLCKRGGLVIERGCWRARLTDEADAPPMTLKGVLAAIG